MRPRGSGVPLENFASLRRLHKLRNDSKPSASKIHRIVDLQGAKLVA
jgi:hypothetical protein